MNLIEFTTFVTSVHAETAETRYIKANTKTCLNAVALLNKNACVFVNQSLRSALAIHVRTAPLVTTLPISTNVTASLDSMASTVSQVHRYKYFHIYL